MRHERRSKRARRVDKAGAHLRAKCSQRTRVAARDCARHLNLERTSQAKTSAGLALARAPGEAVGGGTIVAASVRDSQQSWRVAAHHTWSTFARRCTPPRAIPELRMNATAPLSADLALDRGLGKQSAEGTSGAANIRDKSAELARDSAAKQRQCSRVAALDHARKRNLE